MPKHLLARLALPVTFLALGACAGTSRQALGAAESPWILQAQGGG